NFRRRNGSAVQEDDVELIVAEFPIPSDGDETSLFQKVGHVSGGALILPKRKVFHLDENRGSRGKDGFGALQDRRCRALHVDPERESGLLNIPSRVAEKSVKRLRVDFEFAIGGLFIPPQKRSFSSISGFDDRCV